MKHTFPLFLLVCLILCSCNSATPIKPDQITVQYTAASSPWLGGISKCAGGNVLISEQSGADLLDPQSADMVIRIGQPDNLIPFTYQIGTDNLLVITNVKNPTSELTAERIYELFTGQIQNWKIINGTDALVQPWVFPAGEDIQRIFNQTMLGGSPVSSAARLANNPDEMQQAIEKDINAVGIITSRWKNGSVSSVYTAANSLPVMAITLSKPQGRLAGILACMQK